MPRNQSMLESYQLPIEEDLIEHGKELRKSGRANTALLFTKAESRVEKLRIVKALIDPFEVERMGQSGWIGYDMYCMYSDMMSERNSRIYSNSIMTQKTSQPQQSEQRPLISQHKTEDTKS